MYEFHAQTQVSNGHDSKRTADQNDDMDTPTARLSEIEMNSACPRIVLRTTTEDDVYKTFTSHDTMLQKNTQSDWELVNGKHNAVH